MSQKKENTNYNDKEVKNLKQPQISIGLVGHVDHGKTTITYSLSEKWTDTHSEEVKKGITIRLGYANAKFYKCKTCNGAEAYGTKEICSLCGGKADLVRYVSFVDAPGHETLMATMLSGSAIMDAALLLVAADEECPQPQTKEHLMALQIAEIKNIIIVQNKIDVVTEEEALKNYNQIKDFVKGTIAEHALIIPISAKQGVNIDALIQAIVEQFPVPERDENKDPLMFVARSFDVNKPGTPVKNLIGGILGGAIKQGVFHVGDTIEIRPGRKVEKGGNASWEPLQTIIKKIQTETENLDDAAPGGSVAIGTGLDPGLLKSDSLSGAIVGKPGTLPPVLDELVIIPNLLVRVVGTEKEVKVDAIKRGEPLMVNINSAVSVGVVIDVMKNAFKIRLKLPVCIQKGDKITISRLLGHRYRLIGYGVVKN